MRVDSVRVDAVVDAAQSPCDGVVERARVREARERVAERRLGRPKQTPWRESAAPPMCADALGDARSGGTRAARAQGRRLRWSLASALAAVVPWIGSPAFAQPSFEDVEQAVAVMGPVADDGTIRGVVIFTPGEDRIDVYARIEGLPSGTRHGFHVHVFGDCSDVLTGSAGPHFDPTGNMMRMTSTGMLPLGDLKDLTAGEDGVAEVRFSAPGLSIAGKENAILGRGLLLHESYADPNDPMSSSGDAIACGTIGVYNKDRQKAQ